MQVLSFDQLDHSSVPLAGGKGANLGEMARAGFRVPPGFVVTTEAYRAVLAANGLVPILRRLCKQIDDPSDASSLDEVSRRLQQLILTARVPFDLREAVLEQYRLLSGGAVDGAQKVPPALVAVRSSATSEDSQENSSAGQQDSFLNVLPYCESFDGQSCLRCWSPLGERCDVMAAVQRCWSSLFTARAISYRHQRGVSEELPHIAVVVQRMINGEKSGVLFTVNPLTGDRSQMVVEAAWGLGEGIVSGRVNPDHIILDKEGQRPLRKIIGKKVRSIMLDPATGKTVEAATPSHLVEAEVLSEEELHRVTQLGAAVERHYGAPQDIEFAISGGEVFLLQSRPVTTL